VAGALALTEPGPASAGIVVADERHRVLSQRSRYLGTATRAEATSEALLEAARLALQGGLEAPTFHVDDPALVAAIESADEATNATLAALRETLGQIPGHRIVAVASANNVARTVALAPLVDWLPERTRRAEGLQVRTLDNYTYDVTSEHDPSHSYRVTLRPAGVDGPGEPMSCECGDFVHRGIPCKHLLAVAREVGAVGNLFQADLSARRAS
jgi:hypothetical protein